MEDVLSMDILNKLLEQPKQMAQQPATTRNIQALEKALERFGYTFAYSLIDGISVQYCSDILIYHYCDSSSWLVYSASFLPYLAYVARDGSIEILHGECSDCLKAASRHEHECSFLREMIPIIGKLDALAELEPGKEFSRGPRLRIYL